MRRHVDLSLPFIAIRRDFDGDRYTRTMGEYLCNPLAEDLLDVEVSTGGFFSADDGVIASVPKKENPTYTVPAGEYVRFTVSTRDEYDEMVVHWSLRYRTASGDVRAATFGAGKRLDEVCDLDDVPVLGGPGMVVPRTERG